MPGWNRIAINAQPDGRANQHTAAEESFRSIKARQRECPTGEPCHHDNRDIRADTLCAIAWIGLAAHVERTADEVPMVAIGTVEEKMLELQSRNRALADALLSGSATVTSQISEADLDALFAPAAAT